MFKTLLRKISKPEKVVRADPTLEWDSVEIDSLRVDTVTKRVCSDLASIAFFAPLDGACDFGRPESYKFLNDGVANSLRLNYLKAGFALEFGAGELNYAGFFIGGNAHLPSDATYSKPILNGLKITDATTLESIVDYFGEPVSREDDDDEILLNYKLNDFTVELELSLQQRVTRVNVFPVSA